MQEDKRKVIIIFPDPWLSYSPTLINASKELSVKFPVIILTVGKTTYLDNTFNHEDDIVTSFIGSYNSYLFKLIRILDRIFIYSFTIFLKLKWFNKPRFHEIFIGYNLENFANYILFRRKLKKVYRTGDIIIGVDNVGILAASKFKSEIYALSLEVAKNIFYYFIVWKHVKSLIIQTDERRKYILPPKFAYIRTYFIQNSPFLNGSLSKVNKENNYKLIYLGSLAVRYNALDRIADSLNYLPECYCVVFKGPPNPATQAFFSKNYPELCSSRRVMFDFQYVSNELLPAFLNEYSIGFTLYDIETLPYRSFNVLSCPSGKLFNYYNAGLPVIGNDILGLNSVHQFNTGKLVSELSGRAIANAVLDISQNYNKYVVNAKKAAVHFDFGKAMNCFIQSELII